MWVVGLGEVLDVVALLHKANHDGDIKPLLDSDDIGQARNGVRLSLLLLELLLVLLVFSLMMLAV